MTQAYDQGGTRTPRPHSSPNRATLLGTARRNYQYLGSQRRTAGQQWPRGQPYFKVDWGPG
eukprot:4846207-Pyramimonas_sp.AAC.1